MQQQIGSLVQNDGCGPGNEGTAQRNREKMKKILGMLVKDH
jgi:hypothetical protein